MCSQVFLEYGMQNPNSKSKVFNSFSLKKCFSIIRNLFTGWEPTVNSTLKQIMLVNSAETLKVTYVAPTVFSFKNCGVNWYLTKRPELGSINSSLSQLISVDPSVFTGLAISNRIAPLSKSRILNLTKRKMQLDKKI